MKKSVTKKKKPAKSKSALKPPNCKKPPHSQRNGFRNGSKYALCLDLLYKEGRKKPISRKILTEKYAQLSGKDLSRAGFDLAVILSPTLMDDGTLKFHKSADRCLRQFPYHVKKLNGQVQLFVI